MLLLHMIVKSITFSPIASCMTLMWLVTPVTMVAVVKSVSKAPTSWLRTDLRYASRMRANCLSLEYIQQEISAVNSLEKRSEIFHHSNNVMMLLLLDLLLFLFLNKNNISRTSFFCTLLELQVYTFLSLRI